MSDTDIRQLVSSLQTANAEEEGKIWAQLKPFGASVLPYLVEYYPKISKWRGRVSLVFHAIKYSREHEEAFELGVMGLHDKATLVRYRACMALAYSLRKDAIPHLQKLLHHTDPLTVEDAKAAIDAIKHQNHHYFIDRTHSGSTLWTVDSSDAVEHCNRYGWLRRWSSLTLLSRIKPQMLLLHLTAIAVVVPTTYFAVLGSGIFFSLFFSALRGAPYANFFHSTMAATIALLGCIGVTTLWVLYFQLCWGQVKRRLIIWFGLAAGVTSSMLLIFVAMAGTPWLDRLIAAWPLLAALVFGSVYKARLRSKDSSTSTPHGGAD